VTVEDWYLWASTRTHEQHLPTSLTKNVSSTSTRPRKARLSQSRFCKMSNRTRIRLLYETAGKAANECYYTTFTLHSNFAALPLHLIFTSYLHILPPHLTSTSYLHILPPHLTSTSYLHILSPYLASTLQPRGNRK
jgi:hypothetical protein